jgi:hypothetical protein
VKSAAPLPPQPEAEATPQGLVCFTTTQLGSEAGKSLTQLNAASAQSRTLSRGVSDELHTGSHQYWLAVIN